MAEFSRKSPQRQKDTENNQYPSSFSETLITKAFEKCYDTGRQYDNEETLNEEEKLKHIVRIQYREKSRMIKMGHYAI